MITNKIARSLIIIAAFLCYRYSKYFYAHVVFGIEKWQQTNEYILSSIMLVTGMVMAFTCVLLFTKTLNPGAFGLRSGFLKGLLWGFLCTIPMFIGFSAIKGFEIHYSGELLYRSMVLAGFGEEFIFRAFLFGLLFHYAGWGFVPACILPSLFFGIGHLYQADSLVEAIAVFSFTALASAGFAWFYFAWRSLWMVLFLHGFMDLAFDFCLGEGNVLGGLWMNVFRATTLILAIVFSFRLNDKEYIRSLKRKVWINPESLA